MVMDGEDFGFCVKMLKGRHLHTAGNDAEGVILEDLKLGDVVGAVLGNHTGAAERKIDLTMDLEEKAIVSGC